LKQVLRDAILVGGAAIRISDEPFIYLDKNYVRMFGGVANAVRAAGAVGHRTIAVQVRGETTRVEDEAVEAVSLGATIVMVDTGDTSELARVHAALGAAGCRQQVKLAFGGGIRLGSVGALSRLGADILDIGTEIIDAPIVDFRLDVIA
jgi:nicotinate-nucleotide pyrophosphorylase (carboxylating)